MASTNYTYPSASIDPKKKDKKWLCAYSRAAWGDKTGFIPQSTATSNIGNTRMNEIRLYALGQPPIDKYKKWLNSKDQQDDTWAVMDWTPSMILCKFREILISKILQRKYDVQATAVDPISKTEEDTFFNEQKVKIMMREAARKAGSELADNPVVKAASGEPEDIDQLKIDMDYSYKTAMSMEAEEAIQLIFQQNDSEEKRKSIIEDLVDFGIAGYKEWIDENGMVKYRAVHAENLVISYCRERDFKDAVHVGEYIFVSLNDLAPYFTRDEMQYLCKNVAGKWGNPASFMPTTDRFWDQFKVLVFDLQIITWNTYVYEDMVDNYGNVQFSKTGFEKNKFTGTNSYNQEVEDIEYTEPTQDSVKGEADPKYLNITKKELYKIKWIVGTDYAYDYGISENQNRKQSSWWDTTTDYQLYAWNFNKMQFGGITERLIPIQDNYQLTWMRLQNLKANLIPYLIKIDLDALENVALGKSGEEMTPKEILDLMFQKGVVVYRSSEVFAGKQSNYNPADIVASGQLAAFTQLYEDLRFSIQQMRDVSGLNEVTDGSSPNEKMLTTGLEMANDGTNNAIYLIMDADRKLTDALAQNTILKVQIAVTLGKVSGYIKALGSGTVRFLQINPQISLCEFGIFVHVVPTEQERAQLLNELNLKDSQGLIDPADKIIVMGCRNLKQAAKLLAYRVKKRREEQQEFALQQTQVKAQSDMQLAMQIEQMKQQTIQMQTQGTLMIENLKGEWMYKTELMKKTSDQTEASIQAEAKTIGNHIQAEAKKEAAHIAANSHMAGTQMKGTADLIMTEMDNQTSKETAAKKRIA